MTVVPGLHNISTPNSTNFGSKGSMVERSGVEAEIHKGMVEWPNFQNGFAVLGYLVIQGRENFFTFAKTSIL